ncbi:MAG: integrase family protein [Gammaproteobacteria bacterium]
MRLTKLVVDKLPIPEIAQKGRTAQKRYYDDNLKGFGVRVVSGGTKAFFIEKLVNGKLRRITLGHYPALTVEMARKEAFKQLGEIATGIDPIAKKVAKKVQVITLKEFFNDYLNTKKSLKNRTLYDYKRVMQVSFIKWLNKPIKIFTKDLIEKLHAELGKEHGEAYANLSMRILRALFNYAINKYEDSKGQPFIMHNPVSRLSQSRAWYRVKRRQTYIKPHQLPAWYQAVISLENGILRDLFLFTLFTGLRRQEVSTLKWENVDLKDKVFEVQETKNHQDHRLPLSDFTVDLLKKRKCEAINEYVFPGNGAAGHVVEPRKQVAHVIKGSGVEFTMHDLRRTFITIAESLDISAYAMKRLLNHKASGDVTAGYIIIDIERLRKPMQQISDCILQYIGIQSNDEILD